MIAMRRVWGKINLNVLYTCIKLSNNKINIILKSVHEFNTGKLVFLYTQEKQSIKESENKNWWEVVKMERCISKGRRMDTPHFASHPTNYGQYSTYRPVLPRLKPVLATFNGESVTTVSFSYPDFHSPFSSLYFSHILAIS